jgi:hypothetical protein
LPWKQIPNSGYFSLKEDSNFQSVQIFSLPIAYFQLKIEFLGDGACDVPLGCFFAFSRIGFKASQEVLYPMPAVISRSSEQSLDRSQDGFLQRNRLADGNLHGPLLRNTNAVLSFQKRHHGRKI